MGFPHSLVLVAHYCSDANSHDLVAHYCSDTNSHDLVVHDGLEARHGRPQDVGAWISVTQAHVAIHATAGGRGGGGEVGERESADDIGTKLQSQTSHAPPKSPGSVPQEHTHPLGERGRRKEPSCTTQRHLTHTTISLAPPPFCE